MARHGGIVTAVWAVLLLHGSTCTKLPCWKRSDRRVHLLPYMPRFSKEYLE